MPTIKEMQDEYYKKTGDYAKSIHNETQNRMITLGDLADYFKTGGKK